MPLPSPLSYFSCVQLFTTLWPIACQAPLSIGSSRQEYWSGLPCPSPGVLPDPGIYPRSPALQADFFFFTIWATWETRLTKWRPCESSDVKRMSCNDYDDVATSQGIVRRPSSPQDLGERYKTDAPIQPSERTYPANILIWGMTLTCWISHPQKCEAVHICSDAQLVVLCYGILRKRIQDSNTSSSEPAGMSPAVDQDCPPGGPEGKGQLSAVGSL